MATENFVIESKLSIEAAFDLAIDLSLVPQWDRGIIESHLVHGGQASVGARYEITLTGFDGQPTVAVYEITAVDTNRSFTMVGKHPDFQADDTLTFETTDNGCVVTYDAGLVLLGEEPPVTEAELDTLFASLVAVPREGLASFLNP